MNIKGNQQFQHTHHHIQEVMMSLLETQSIRNITVRSICEQAHINRSTFYAHYLDIYDLLENMNEALTLKMVKSLRPEEVSAEELLTRPYNWDFLEFIQANKTFFKAWTQYSPQCLFRLNGINLLEYIAERRMSMRRISDPAEQTYFNAFSTGGMNAVLNIWLKSDCREDAQTIRDLLKRCSPKPKQLNK